MRPVGEEEASEEDEEKWDLVIRCVRCHRPVLKINSRAMRFKGDRKEITGIWCECRSSDVVVKAAAFLLDYPIATYWCVLCSDCYDIMRSLCEGCSKLIYGIKTLAETLEQRLWRADT